MHATHYGFHSTSGVKHFFGRNADLSERLVPERKPYLCKVMSSKEDIQPSENDILLGRGGKNNQHSGNEKLRAFARVQARKYNTSSKKGKSILSRILVKQMRELDPPARFLKKDQATGKWEEAGEDTAREKASQVLRDAVAQLEGSSDEPESTNEKVKMASVPLEVESSSVPRRAGIVNEATPVLQSVTPSWSSSTPRSHESPDRHKRRRLTVLSPQGSNTFFSYPSYHDTILHSPVRVDPWQQGTFQGGPYTFPPQAPRYPIQPPLSPPLIPYHYSQAHYGRHTTRRLSIGSRPLDPLDPNFHDFDLFQGDLLDTEFDDIIHSTQQHPF
ncbi:hypothetical protein FisN_3Hh556 [Fistulifera solaris]|uniref:DUF6824 domain-containing protein n=1 Tax=Fistulifera solaris TaxID=1519565 RepID=A0A1Z5K2W5_FISSO|nr:hypothetical protein FisN_3Hh556 [Fistulifera solaris]|eukprot:GAX20593.1 hypothetical protein FisN_3Hh556 [Fistulifera solaris]